MIKHANKADVEEFCKGMGKAVQESTDNLNFPGLGTKVTLALIRTALVSSQYDMAEKALDSSIDIDKPDSSGNTVLMNAAAKGNVPPVLFEKILEKTNREIYNHKNNAGITAVDLLAINLVKNPCEDTLDNFQMLIEAGCLPDWDLLRKVLTKENLEKLDELEKQVNIFLEAEKGALDHSI